jgi:hypothetical protein
MTAANVPLYELRHPATIRARKIDKRRLLTYM